MSIQQGTIGLFNRDTKILFFAFTILAIRTFGSINQPHNSTSLLKQLFTSYRSLEIEFSLFS